MGRSMEGTLMHTLSIRQPWAWLITSGLKDVENRTWFSPYRGPLLIHAGKALDPDLKTREALADMLAFMELELDGPIPDPAQLPRGGIVGSAYMTGCVSDNASDWFCGPFGFKLEHAKEIPFRPCKGALGFFQVDLEALPEGPAALPIGFK